MGVTVTLCNDAKASFFRTNLFHADEELAFDTAGEGRAAPSLDGELRDDVDFRETVGDGGRGGINPFLVGVIGDAVAGRREVEPLGKPLIFKFAGFFDGIENLSLEDFAAALDLFAIFRVLESSLSSSSLSAACFVFL